MKLNQFVKSFSLLLLMIFSGSASGQAAPDPLCLASRCGGELFSCGFDQDCREWLQCVVGCGDDKIRCPSVCGFFYQGTKINKTNQCIIRSQCVDLGFSRHGHYEPPHTELFPADILDGTWWFAGSHGGDHIFDFDCQQFAFKKKRPGTVDVAFSVPLMLKSKKKITKAAGIFRTLSTGAIEVIYDNFVGYHENWYIVDATPNTVLAHVCIADQERSPPQCYDYGTILLARQPLITLDSSQIQHLNAATENYFNFPISQMRLTKVSGCPQEDSM